MFKRTSSNARTHGWVCPFFILFLVVSTLNSQGQDPGEAILGKWEMVSNGDGFLEATLQFDQGNHYELVRKWPDESIASVKGGYLLDSGSTPLKLRLCLGDCNAEGSEWTSMFSIMHTEDDDMLEIYFSDSGNFPGGFPDDPGSKGLYVFKRLE